MLLTVEEMIKTLRSSVNVQVPIEETIIDEETGEEIVVTKEGTDPAYLTMTDDDITLFIKLGVSRAYPSVTDLSDLPSGSEYPIILLAKIELYTKLAVIKADKVDMGVDNNNYIKQGQRFSHYMSLVATTQEQYQSWLDNEGVNGGQGVTSYDVLLGNRHYTQRNFEKQVTPKVSLKIDQVTSDSVNFHWGVTNTSHFGRFKVYISKSPIIDMYKEGVTYDKKVDDEAKLVVSTQNIRNTFHKVNNLESETTYYVAVISIERNQVFGYSEISFNTLAVLPDEDEVLNDSFVEEVTPDDSVNGEITDTNPEDTPPTTDDGENTESEDNSDLRNDEPTDDIEGDEVSGDTV